MSAKSPTVQRTFLDAFSTLMTPVGVLPFASCLSIFTSALDHGSRVRRLYEGFAWPFLPIGEPGRSMMLLPLKSSCKSFLNEGISNSVLMNRNGRIGAKFFVDQGQRRCQCASD